MRKIAGYVALTGILIVAELVLTAISVMILWNWLMPSLAGLKTIDFMEALGLSILFKLLLESLS